MFNDASLPEDEAWAALARDLTAAKKARNETERLNLYVLYVACQPHTDSDLAQTTSPRPGRDGDSERIVSVRFATAKMTCSNLRLSGMPRCFEQMALFHDPSLLHCCVSVMLDLLLCYVFCTVRICTLSPRILEFLPRHFYFPSSYLTSFVVTI